MTTKAHKLLTGADLHEPKGIATATSGQVYQADGAGSGVWTALSIPTGNFKITSSEFTSSGTWTKPANLIGIVFHIIGGGGGANGAGGTATAGGTTSFGTLATVNGGAAGNTASSTNSFGAGGSLGTTPSGAHGYTGITGLSYYPIGPSSSTWITQGFKDSVSGSVTIPSSFIMYTLCPGPFGTTFKGAGANVTNVNNGIAGGGSGGYMTGWLSESQLGATESVTIGAAGGSGAGAIALAGIIGYCLVDQYIKT